MIVIKVPVQQLEGEVTRYILNSKGLTARKLAEHIGLYEANVSTMLRTGASFKKYKDSILEFVGISNFEYLQAYSKAKEVLESLGVEIGPQVSVLHVGIAYKEFQNILEEYM